ncbi:ecto-ADP-ribosyltransferase 4-like [Labrus mixtus]|uniref:ecto-ADP-ribosyltransferase 4-like n=1 Tax=Labrus mixtus TaxID=508554 RepID=UPI0029C060F0|nr:ecto-ADP-ribosyltransferase 4-like [Labrus mixtus]
MLTFISFFLLCGWMLPADFMAIRFNFPLREKKTIPLSMVEDSVDDMYFGCQEKMMEKVKTYYFNKEIRNRKFESAWNEAAECAEKKPKEADKALTKDHMHAICVYTDNTIYDIFNTAVRTEASDYSSSFQFHSLHFLLTSAIQILNSNSKCHTTYRRTESLFSGDVGQIIRFGSFASSSYYNNLTDFGSETCFKIKTCAGAYLGDYSAIDGEEEVLIPPYEIFKVTEKVLGKGNFGELNDCKVVYVLESTGGMSRLNCKAALP